MAEIPQLESFVPKNKLTVPVEIRQELAPVVERISKIIPPLFCGIFFLALRVKQGEKLNFLTPE